MRRRPASIWTAALVCGVAVPVMGASPMAAGTAGTTSGTTTTQAVGTALVIRPPGSGPQARAGDSCTYDYSNVVSLDASAIDQQSDRKYIVVGSATVKVGATNESRYAIARVEVDETGDDLVADLDPTFGAAAGFCGLVLTDLGLKPGASDPPLYPRDVRVLTDDSIIVGGNAYWYNGDDGIWPNERPAGSKSKGINSNFALVKYTPEGQLDTAFGASYAGNPQPGTVLTAIRTNDRINALDLDGSKIVVGGQAKLQDPASIRFALARYNANGSVDTSFQSNGFQFTDFGGPETVTSAVLDVFVGDNSSVYAIGAAQTDVSKTYKFAVLADTTQNGTSATIKRTFVPVPGDSIENVATAGEVRDDGGIVAVGYAVNDSTLSAQMVAASLDADLRFTSTFGNNGVAVTRDENFVQSALWSVELVPGGATLGSGFVSGRIPEDVEAGDSLPDPGLGPVAWALARFLPDGTPDEVFGPAGIAYDYYDSLDDGVRNDGFDGAVDLLVEPDGTTIAAGTLSLADDASSRSMGMVLFPTTSVEYTGSLTGTAGRWPVAARLRAGRFVDDVCLAGTTTFTLRRSGTVVGTATATTTGGVGSVTAATSMDVPTGTDRIDVAFRPTEPDCLGSSTRLGMTVTAAPGTALVPTLGSPVALDGGFRVEVTNHDPAFLVSATSSSGTATVGTAANGRLPITVSGLEDGNTATLTVTTNRSGHPAGTASITGRALREQRLRSSITVVERPGKLILSVGATNAGQNVRLRARPVDHTVEKRIRVTLRDDGRWLLRNPTSERLKVRVILTASATSEFLGYREARRFTLRAPR